jgi:beta-lactamase regulating signal transducer with metallopeptidase domain
MKNACNAFYWTLVHSLWIGLAAALLTAVVLIIVPARAAAKRYQLLCALLSLFVLATAAIFIMEWRNAAPDTIEGSLPLIPTKNAQTVTTDLTHGYWAGLTNWLNTNRDLLLFVWMTCFALKSFRLAGSLVYIGRIRSRGVSPVSAALQEKLQTYSKQLGIRRTIQLLQSGKVELPVTFGWLKPVILIPAGLLLQAMPEQLDSILWHELAHIFRRDYLVNLLQELVETLFFFNPALLWLCARIRTEREACCDDLAISRVSRRKDYVQTLLALQERPGQSPGLALGTGSGKQLRRRLQRLVSAQTGRSNTGARVLAIAALLLLTALTLLSGKTADRFKPAPPDTLVYFNHLRFDHSNADPDNCRLLAGDKSGNTYRITISAGALSSLQLNRSQVPQSRLSHYAYLLSSLKRTLGRKHRDAYPAPIVIAPQGHHDTDRVKQVIAALIREKIVNSADEVNSFSLSDTQLTINGQAQPQGLQARLKTLAGVGKDYGLFYGPVRMSGKGVLVDKTDLR